MKKKIKYSEFTTPQPPALTRFTPVSSKAVAPRAPEADSIPAEPPPVRKKAAPVDLARALANARSLEAIQTGKTLAHVEARGAAAHARGLAAAEVAGPTEVEPTREPVAAIVVSVQATSPVLAPTPTLTTAPEQALEREAPPELEPGTEAAVLWENEELEARGPRRPLRERARTRSGFAELLMFRVGVERFAVELICVEEAIDLPDVHHVPEMPPAMLGVITVRGSLTPVFTPREALGVAVEGQGAALIFRAERGRFALAIDDVDDVLTLDLAMLRDAPGIDGTDSVVLGVARHEGAIVALVDADALVLACQAIPVLELV